MPENAFNNRSIYTLQNLLQGNTQNKKAVVNPQTFASCMYVRNCAWYISEMRKCCCFLELVDLWQQSVRQTHNEKLCYNVIVIGVCF